MSRIHEETIEAFLISKQKTLGNIKYLTLYSEKIGLFEACLKSSSNLKNHFQGKLENLTKAEFTIFHGRTHRHIKQIQNAKTDHLDNLTTEKQNFIATICQIIQKISPKEQSILGLQEILETTRKNLPLVAKPELLFIYTLVQIIYRIGIMFDPKFCQNCQQELKEKSFLNENQLHCPNCQKQGKAQFIVDTSTRKTIFYGISTDFQTFSQIKIPERTQTQTIYTLKNILENYLQATLKLFLNNGHH